MNDTLKPLLGYPDLAIKEYNPTDIFSTKETITIFLLDNVIENGFFAL